MLNGTGVLTAVGPDFEICPDMTQMVTTSPLSFSTVAVIFSLTTKLFPGTVTRTCAETLAAKTNPRIIEPAIVRRTFIFSIRFKVGLNCVHSMDEAHGRKVSSHPLRAPRSRAEFRLIVGDANIASKRCVCSSIVLHAGKRIVAEFENQQSAGFEKGGASRISGA